MIRFIVGILALAVSLGAAAEGAFDPSAKYVQLDFTIDIPQMEQASPSTTLVVGQPARLSTVVEEGVGYRLDVLAKRLFVGQKGRPLVELEWTLFSSEDGKLILKSETQALVVANDDSGATFTTAAVDNEDDLVQIKVITRIVSDAEIIAKLGKLPDVAACPADTGAPVMPKGGNCCQVGCGPGQVLTCCGAVWCCCNGGPCCSPP